MLGVLTNLCKEKFTNWCGVLHGIKVKIQKCHSPLQSMFQTRSPLQSPAGWTQTPSKSNTPADHDPDQLGGSPTSRSGWTQIHRREWRTTSEDEARERRQGWVFGQIWVREWTLNAWPELGTGMDDRFSTGSGFEKAESLDRFGFPARPTKPMQVCVGFRPDL